MSSTLTRREFLKTTSLTLACILLPTGSLVLEASEALSQPIAPFVWLQIHADNSVEIFTNKSEMGQGIHTGIALVVADELEADMAQVRLTPAPVTSDYVDPVFRMHLTGGSTSLRNVHEPLRLAAAMAREMLVAAAAAEWKVAPESCRAELGWVIHASGQKLSYGALATKAALLKKPQNPPLKSAEAYRYRGKPFIRLDMHEKSTGKARFAGDMQIPGMLHAVAIKPPRIGATFTRVGNESTLHELKGFVKILPLQEGIALVASSMDVAMKAARMAKVEFSDGIMPNLTDAVVTKELSARLSQASGDIAIESGDAKATLKECDVSLEATYTLPYLHHMLMEPLCTLASVSPESCEIWSGTQNQTACMMVAKQITGLPEEKIAIHTTYLGTGLGRRANADFVADALMLSKTLGKPVMLQYDREAEIKSGKFRPASLHTIACGVKAGKLHAWHHEIAAKPLMKSSGFGKKEGADHATVEGISDTLYGVENLQVIAKDYETPVPIWFWRSVGNSQNGFVMETLMDALAHKAKMDPVAFRLNNLTAKPHAQTLLKEVAAMAEWGKPSKKGLSKGCAIHHCFGSTVAQVAEIGFDPQSGRIRVEQVWCGVDMGPFTVHPDSVIAQMEGAILMGISAALYEEVHFERGGVTQQNFHNYPIARMSDAPKAIHVKILNLSSTPGGIGEPGLPPIAPAIANALFGLTGLRARTLPLTSKKILDALKAKESILG